MNKRVWIWLVVAFVVIGITIPVITSGLASSILAGLTGDIKLCDDAPYSEECICPEGMRKVYVPWLGLSRWSCEDLEQLIIDPESPTFEQDAKKFVVAYLDRHCGDVCTDLTCGENKLCSSYSGSDYYFDDLEAMCQKGINACISAVYGYGSAGERIVNIECAQINEWDASCRPKSGTIPWRMNFFVEGATELPKANPTHSNYCVDPDATERCEPPMDRVNLLSLLNPFGSLNDMGSGFPAPIR